MIPLDCKQRSQAWMDARLGIATASQFKRILTPAGKLSKSRDEYLGELLAEFCLGEEIRQFGGTEWTDRGLVLEPEALKYYSFQRDTMPEKVGFIYKDESRLAGCSPDGLVGEDGLLEIKAPMAGTHLLWLVRGICPAAHMPQVQGQLWVTGRAWCDFMSYYPGLPELLVRVHPDAEYQGALDQHMPVFLGEIVEGRERLAKLGVKPANAADQEPAPANPVKSNMETGFADAAQDWLESTDWGTK